MKKVILIFWVHLLGSVLAMAQCLPTETKITVQINTDQWGEETHWTLSDLSKTILIQGGQGGVYDDLSSYTDSICLPTNGCYFFRIYDSWGDGIVYPGFCHVFENGNLVYSGSNNIGSFDEVSIQCSDSCNLVLQALTRLRSHLDSNALLSGQELLNIRNIFQQYPTCLSTSDSIVVLTKNTLYEYEQQHGALFVEPNTRNGFSKDESLSPGLELERAILALQQGAFDYIFTPDFYSIHPKIIRYWAFASSAAFPGVAPVPTDSTKELFVSVLASCTDPDGANPYFGINAEGTDHALRPTGWYLAPGTVAQITVPMELIGRDFYIRVGSHEWDLTERSDFRRFDRISKKFPIVQTTTEIFNPFGGAISILIPYGADLDLVEIKSTNVLETPYFSLKNSDDTIHFNDQLNKPGPWAVFETENVLFTIPKHSIVPGQYDIKKVLTDWETALRGLNSILSRQIIPDKHTMYMIADADIRTGVYSIGYPMSNTPLSYYDTLGPVYFLNGPGPDDEVNFHELGHALAISKFVGEEEALVNVPYIMALNYGLGVDFEEAVRYSFVPNTFNTDNTVTHRLVSNTFGTKRDVSNTTTDEVRYQHRGYGHYLEIVRMLGWCPLRNFWRREFLDAERGINHGINDQDTDDRIVRMSVAAGVDLRPVFHVFGLLPEDSLSVQDSLLHHNIHPSSAVYDRIQAYFGLIPQDPLAFEQYALSVYPNLYTEGPQSDPDYGVGWHYQKSLTYSIVEAQNRTDILNDIVQLYFPDGPPSDSIVQETCCVQDSLKLIGSNNQWEVKGGVPPYTIISDTTDTRVKVTAIDYNGCSTEVSYSFYTPIDEVVEGVKIFPNPSNSEVFITTNGIKNRIVLVQLLSLSGQAISPPQKSNRIDVSSLRSGVYIVRIEWSDGTVQSERIIVLRP